MAAKRKATKTKKSTTKRSAPKRKASSVSGSSKRLTRSSKDKMITGVIGGLAQYLNVDSTILRLIWIAVVAFTGFVPGVLVYGAASLLIPEK